MLAAENGALLGGKVGGMADVIRDVPPILIKKGYSVDIVTPSYGFLHVKNKSTKIKQIGFVFRNNFENATVYKVEKNNGVNYYLIDNPIFNIGGENIYFFDPPHSPFSTDATRFALFCTAVSELLKEDFFSPDIIHLHDWHTCFLLLLLKYHKNYKKIKKRKIVLTIHNLAFQGVRPFENDKSSLSSWFEDEIILTKKEKEAISDPRWKDCFNPLAIGIRYSDVIHVVSPSYAKEILKPSNPPLYYGGEGLENDLNKAYNENRLKGILNGCFYSDEKQEKPSFSYFITTLISEIEKMLPPFSFVPSSLFLAHARLNSLKEKNISLILTSVARITEQKVFLLTQKLRNEKMCIEEILELIGEKGIYIIQGTGEKKYEEIFIETSKKYKNFVFINGYSEICANLLYSKGDLFLMPSLFEPCGISQMLAMREGQPCIVNEVGGLKDTVINEVDGFSFSGESIEEKINNFLNTLKNAINIKNNKKEKWNEICENAKRKRFNWEDSVEKYIKELYGN